MRVNQEQVEHRWFTAASPPCLIYFLKNYVLSPPSPSDQRTKLNTLRAALRPGFECLMVLDLTLCGFLSRPGLGGVCSLGIKECTHTPRLKPTPVVAFRPVSRRCKGRNSLSEWLAPFHGSKSDRISMSMWPAYKETAPHLGEESITCAGTHQTWSSCIQNTAYSTTL
ncbi:hypothetical protein ASPFODRAFT_40136 [Aspergillus luchuensis CBS 106.47]|uniref:Uncharacterized protein n=1 Tax=Aspergillus luchuensis (strain CBS 106.47) TaxID=1137211 RepID=A0A1M3U111_ASPLC|nr:hypothetical protein ASPFODRAFT_40136 [Aspergillus luchuensis CBS 106.47]